MPERDPRTDPRPGDAAEMDGSAWRVIVRDGRMLIIYNGITQMAVTVARWRDRVTAVLRSAEETD